MMNFDSSWSYVSQGSQPQASQPARAIQAIGSLPERQPQASQPARAIQAIGSLQ